MCRLCGGLGCLTLLRQQPTIFPASTWLPYTSILVPKITITPRPHFHLRQPSLYINTYGVFSVPYRVRNKIRININTPRYGGGWGGGWGGGGYWIPYTRIPPTFYPVLGWSGGTNIWVDDTIRYLGSPAQFGLPPLPIISDNEFARPRPRPTAPPAPSLTGTSSGNGDEAGHLVEIPDPNGNRVWVRVFDQEQARRQHRRARLRRRRAARGAPVLPATTTPPAAAPEPSLIGTSDEDTNTEAEIPPAPPYSSPPPPPPPGPSRRVSIPTSPPPEYRTNPPTPTAGTPRRTSQATDPNRPETPPPSPNPATFPNRNEYSSAWKKYLHVPAFCEVSAENPWCGMPCCFGPGMDGEIPASAGGPAGAGGGRYGTGPHRKVWFKGKNGDEVAREVWITIPETEGERRRGLWDENGVVGG